MGWPMIILSENEEDSTTPLTKIPPTQPAFTVQVVLFGVGFWILFTKFVKHHKLKLKVLDPLGPVACAQEFHQRGKKNIKLGSNETCATFPA
jgi:hypothetical protein